MRHRRRSLGLRSLLGLAALIGGLSAQPVLAACRQPLVVPAAPTGRLVIVEGERVHGAMPELLREIGRSIGCEFVFPVLPRARAHLEVFERARMDILVPAGRNTERDQLAQFVPLLQESVALVLRAEDGAAAPASLAELRARRHWRAALVRSYAFSDSYVALADALKSQQRADLVNDPVAALRMLQAGRVQFTLLPPSALQEADAALRRAVVLRRLPELPPMEFGAYLSYRSMEAGDRRLIAEQLIRATREGLVRTVLLRYYPAELLDWGQR